MMAFQLTSTILLHKIAVLVSGNMKKSLSWGYLEERRRGVTNVFII